MRDEIGQIRAKPVEGTDGETLVGFVQKNAPVGDEVVTDAFRASNSFSAKGFTHKKVRHFAGESVCDMARTSGI